MIEPFETKETLDSTNYISDSIKAKENTVLKLILITLIPTITIIIIIGIIIIIISNSNFEKDKIEIICEYEVGDNKKPINLLSKDFEKESGISIYVNNEIVSYNINHTFKFTGLPKVKFILNKKVKFENMFKDVKDLYSVEIPSANKGDFGLNFSKAFINCQNLRTFKAKINLENIIDMSYMFSNCKALRSVIF